MTRIERHRDVQTAAKRILGQLLDSLTPIDSERSIGARAERMLAAAGMTQTWYYKCPALVLAGPRTCLSMSGRDYVPSDDEIGPTNLVTVDLSPSVEGIWGDCARCLFIEEGLPVPVPQKQDFVEGTQALRQLHASVQAFAKPNMSFEFLCEFASSEIRSLGFVNLDFRGNVGHSIERECSERSFIEPGNRRLLQCNDLFTFEPHIKALQGSWGFKHEEIYYFDHNQLWVL